MCQGDDNVNYDININICRRMRKKRMPEKKT